ncbi:MAG TPA: Fur family transcriptional regulator [Polyangiaceae bacterium]|nr:Fur family transcriptional regulator [Polyangiaceae bacterium]
MSKSRQKSSVPAPAAPTDPLDRALDVFRDALHQRGLRYSSVREAIARAAVAYPGQFEVNDLMRELQQAEVKDAHLATIYRTLPLLVETGLIRPALLSSGERHFYEPAFERPHHDHLICSACGKIVEFEFEAFEVLQQDIAKHYGFELMTHVHELIGRCGDCQRLPATSAAVAEARESEPQ